MSDTKRDIEKVIVGLHSDKEKIAAEKKSLEADLSEINNRIRASRRIDPVKYRELCHRQNELKQMIADAQISMSSIKQRIRDLSVQKTEKGDEEHSVSFKSMTLRDYFAAKAMQAIIAKHPLVIAKAGEPDPDPDLEIEAARGAYSYADAMLEARKPE